MPKFALPLILAAVLIFGIFLFLKSPKIPKTESNLVNTNIVPSPSPKDTFPLQIEVERQKQYPGSDLKIEQTLAPGSNYSRYVASYQSEGNKIYGMLTIPNGQKPEAGWPVIIFNHGYIPPEIYRTTERYLAYVDGFARNGYVVFKSDYRGNGSSEGDPQGAYYSDAYPTDVLNGLASVKKLSSKSANTDPLFNNATFPIVNNDKIGMWGHSMGGSITLRSMVISKDIKAGVIWGGVVGTYDDLLNHWHRAVPFQPSARERPSRNNQRQNIITKYGAPDKNPDFWHSIDPNYYLSDISGPLQLHHGEADEEVPLLFSQHLKENLDKIGKPTDLFTYPGADHNISSPSFEIAMDRSIKFFDKYLK